jgi:hypothetical protein
MTISSECKIVFDDILQIAWHNHPNKAERVMLFGI